MINWGSRGRWRRRGWIRRLGFVNRNGLLLLLRLRSEAPLGEERRLHLPRVLEGRVANLSGHLLANFLRKELGHKSVDLFAHSLGLKVAHFLRLVDANVHGGVVTLGWSGDKLAVVGGAGLKGEPLALGTHVLFVV